MATQISSKCGKLKKSKLEKIFELETDLKLSQEENDLLREQLEALKHSRPAIPSKYPCPESIDKNEFQRMNDAFQALKKVSISQEQGLHSLRIEVLQSRKKDKEQLLLIESLQSRILTLDSSQRILAESKSADQALEKQVENLQQLFFLEQCKTAKLNHELEEKNKAIETLQTRLSRAVERKDSERSLLSRKASERSLMSRKASERNVLSRKSSNRNMSRKVSERSMMDVSSSTNRSQYTRDTSFRSRRSTSDRSLGTVSFESFNSSSRMGTDTSPLNTSVSWREDNRIPDAHYVQQLESELGTKKHQIAELASHLEMTNGAIKNLKIRELEMAAKKQIMLTGSQASVGESSGDDFYEDADISDSTFW